MFHSEEYSSKDGNPIKDFIRMVAGNFILSIHAGHVVIIVDIQQNTAYIEQNYISSLAEKRITFAKQQLSNFTIVNLNPVEFGKKLQTLELREVLK